MTGSYGGCKSSFQRTCVEGRVESLYWAPEFDITLHVNWNFNQGFEKEKELLTVFKS